MGQEEATFFFMQNTKKSSKQLMSLKEEHLNEVKELENAHFYSFFLY